MCGGLPAFGREPRSRRIWRRVIRRRRMMVSKRMADANDQERTEQEKRPLTLRTGGTLGLRPRPAESGSVRQSFSHGRSKQVTVEVRKKRVVAPGAAPVETARSDTAAPTVA